MVIEAAVVVVVRYVLTSMQFESLEGWKRFPSTQHVVPQHIRTSTNTCSVQPLLDLLTLKVFWVCLCTSKMDDIYAPQHTQNVCLIFAD